MMMLMMMKAQVKTLRDDTYILSIALKSSSTVNGL